MKTVEEFWALVDKKDEAPEACWAWKGGKHGSVNWNGKVTQAKRLSYVLSNGDIPEGTRLQMQCKGDGCVRPSHMKQKGEPGYQHSPQAQKALKPVKKKRVSKIPTVIVDRDSRLLSLIQELTTEADKVDQDRKKAFIKCADAREAIDEALLKLQTMRDGIEHLAGKMIPVFRDEDFTRFAEEGKRLREEEEREKEKE